MSLLLLFSLSGGSPLSETSGLGGTISVGPLRNPSTRVARNSTNTISLKGFRIEVTGLYPIDGVVQFTILDASGSPVTGAQDIAMPYISGVGRRTHYRGVLLHTVVLSLGSCTIRVTGTDATGNVRVFDKSVDVVAG